MIYNVQFMTFRRDARGLEALHWWRDRCIEWCYYRVEDGKLGDQKYLDDWPERFDGVHVLEHPGGGLAPWNVENYELARRNGSRAGRRPRARLLSLPLASPVPRDHARPGPRLPLGATTAIRADRGRSSGRRTTRCRRRSGRWSGIRTCTSSVVHSTTSGVRRRRDSPQASSTSTGARSHVRWPVVSGRSWGRRALRGSGAAETEAPPSRKADTSTVGRVATWPARCVSSPTQQLEDPTSVPPYRAFLEAVDYALVELPLPEPARFLDFGCGVGHYSELLERRYPGRFVYTGCDYRGGDGGSRARGVARPPVRRQRPLREHPRARRFRSRACQCARRHHRGLRASARRSARVSARGSCSSIDSR